MRRKYSEFQANFPSDLKKFQKNATDFHCQDAGESKKGKQNQLQIGWGFLPAYRMWILQIRNLKII
jgi:hypothetical protein